MPGLNIITIPKISLIKKRGCDQQKTEINKIRLNGDLNTGFTDFKPWINEFIKRLAEIQEYYFFCINQI